MCSTSCGNDHSSQERATARYAPCALEQATAGRAAQRGSVPTSIALCCASGWYRHRNETRLLNGIDDAEYSCPDIVVEIVQHDGARRLAVLALKASSSASYLATNFSQLFVAPAATRRTFPSMRKTAGIPRGEPAIACDWTWCWKAVTSSRVLGDRVSEHATSQSRGGTSRRSLRCQ